MSDKKPLTDFEKKSKEDKEAIEILKMLKGLDRKIKKLISLRKEQGTLD